MTIKKILFLGDSQAAGVVPHLAAALDPQKYLLVYGQGFTGLTTRGLLESSKLEDALARYQPDVVVLYFGGNDTANERYTSTLTDVAGLAISTGAQLIWIGPALAARDDVDERHAAVAQMQRTFFDQAGVPWINAREFTTAGHRTDGVHFTQDAYRYQARQIAGRLDAILAPSSRVALWVAGGLGLVGLGLLLRWAR